MNKYRLKVIGSIFLICAFIGFGHVSAYGTGFSSTKISPQLSEKMATFQKPTSTDTVTSDKDSEMNSFTPTILETSSIEPGILETSFIGRGNPRLIYTGFKWVSPYQNRLPIKLRGL